MRLELVLLCVHPYHSSLCSVGSIVGLPSAWYERISSCTIQADHQIVGCTLPHADVGVFEVLK